MGNEYVVEKAICICQFGSTPSRLRVTDNFIVHMNGKLVATNMTLGDVFDPPGFGMCNINPSSPKPCMPSVAQWTEFYKGVVIGNSSYPLTNTSQGTCALGCSNCIMLKTTGQNAIPNIVQMRKAAATFQYDINPIGSSDSLKYEDNLD